MFGPANDSFLRSHSIRYVWGDEESGDCEACQGIGLCEECEGTGRVERPYILPSERVISDCGVCEGTGKEKAE